ncbi:hypothetical protein [Streptomyces paludis]|uniref:hypothetical protein n=1 Tax=Streptomyces paludis TaxID=2282738 RepID=UPI0013B37427|nr:hypothetical protein [Streptomyces paludis]
MAICKKCDTKKRSWPRSCPRCRAGKRTEKVASEVGDLVVPGGGIEWVGRGIAAVVRLVVRAVN